MKVVWTTRPTSGWRPAVFAAIGLLALLAGTTPARAQYGPPFPQPLTQAGYCPTCDAQGAYYPASNTQGGYCPTCDANGGGFSGPHCFSAPPSEPACPELYSGYAVREDLHTGWYVGGAVGACYLEDQFSEAIDSNLQRNEDATFDWNACGGMSVGYRFPVHPRDMGQLRIEFDTFYRENKVKTLRFNGVEQDPEGEVMSNSFMFNVALDLINCCDAVTPYVGGGVGVLHVSEHLEYGQARFVDTDLVFGFQGMAGLSLKLWENVEWFTEFRYLGGSNPKLIRIGPPAPPNRVELRSEYNTYSVVSGLRINLY